MHQFYFICNVIGGELIKDTEKIEEKQGRDP